MKSSKLYWRTDEAIRAQELRVIGSDGKQLGVMKKDKALETAKKEKLTLVEIAPNASPPVAKIVEFGKFRYREEKKLRERGKKAKGTELKEIRFSPFIAENDYQTRLARVTEFLEDKDKVRLVVVFKGPQMRSREFGYNLLKRIVGEYGEGVAVDMQPKFLGKHLIMIISPRSAGLNPPKNKEAKDAETENKKSTN